MNKLLICTHGKFGEELVRSVEMIAGKLNNTIAISLLPTMSIDDYIEKIRDNLEEENNYLCLTDLFGGTPCNSLVSLSREYNLDIICGVNMPMVLESTSILSSKSMDEIKEQLLHVYDNSGFDVLKKIKEGINNGN